MKIKVYVDRYTLVNAQIHRHNTCVIRYTLLGYISGWHFCLYNYYGHNPIKSFDVTLRTPLTIATAMDTS